MTTNTENFEHDKIRAEISKIMAETVKINTEAQKIAQETWWYPMTIGAVLTLTLMTITAGIFKLLV